MNEEEIIKKIKDGQELTPKDNLYYLTEIIGHSKEEAERIIAIADNTNKDVLMD